MQRRLPNPARGHGDAPCLHHVGDGGLHQLRLLACATAAGLWRRPGRSGAERESASAWPTCICRARSSKTSTSTRLELKEAASLGITILFSSGDTADYLPAGADVAETSWPASSPWATAVGGTSLLLNKKGPGKKVETGWGTYANPTYDGVVWTGPFQLEALGWEGWFFASGSGGGTGRASGRSRPIKRASFPPRYRSISTPWTRHRSTWARPIA